MNKIIMFLLLAFFSCSRPSKVNIEKIDSSFFIGEYISSFNGEIERVYLKPNGYYDYGYGKDDTIVENVGEWKFIRYSNTFLSIELYSFPMKRKYVVFENLEKIDFDVNTSVSYLGDLKKYVDVDMNAYIFKKTDKSKNKDYIISHEERK